MMSKMRNRTHIDRGVLLDIVRDGIRAPSGDNSQPWRFEIAQDRIMIFHVPEEETEAKHTVPYYYKASCIAHGALIENMLVSAAHRGYEVRVDYFPEKIDENHIATLIFEVSEKEPHGRADLQPYIIHRHSNRRRFNRTPLSNTESQVLYQAAENDLGVKLRITERPEYIKAISRNLVDALILTFKNRKLFDFFISHTVFSKQETEHARALDVRLLDLLPFGKFPLRMFTFRPFFYFMYYTGLLRLSMTWEYVRFLRTAGYGLLYAEKNDRETHVNAGRVLEHLWLTATAHDIAFHPCTATFYVYNNMLENPHLFSEKEKDQINMLYDDLMGLFGLPSASGLFLMRLGHATPMKVRSGRAAPQIREVTYRDDAASRLKHTIEDLIADGILAPSAENTQPWKFRVRKNVIETINTGVIEESLIPYYESVEYMAHGALAETIAIAAPSHGLKARVELLPKGAGERVMTRLTVTTDTHAKRHALYPFLAKRHTNRKFYERQPLHDTEVRDLLSVTKDRDVSGIGVKICNDLDVIETLSDSFLTSDYLLFSNKMMHDFFFEHFYWHKENHPDGRGLFAPTLEVSPFQIKGLRVMKSPTCMKVIESSGMLKKLIRASNTRYRNSGGMAIIYADADDEVSLLKAGRAMQRLWLVATKHELWLHPCTGLLHFYHGALRDIHVFNEQQRALIMKAYERIESTFEVKGKHIFFFTRIGRAESPTAVTTRTRPEIEYVD